MKDKRSGRSQFSLSALVGFVVFAGLLGWLISFQSRTIDRVSAFVFVGLRAAAAIGFLWVVWRRHRGWTRARAVPKWYRKWVLDEDDR